MKTEPTLTKDEVLRDLLLWMRRHLQTTHPRQNPPYYLSPNKTTGYAVVEVPDWEMRQKLANVEDALKEAPTDPEGVVGVDTRI